MNALVKLQTLALGKGAVTSISPPSVSGADGSTASIGREEGGLLVATSVGFDPDGMGLEDVGISARVVPDVHALGLAGAVVVAIGGDHVGKGPGAEAEEGEGLSEMHGCEKEELKLERRLFLGE